MTREDIKRINSEYLDDTESTFEMEEVFALAIKAIEQEPVLDKITELIEPLRHLSIDQMSDIEWLILREIDKYKTEIELQESEDKE